MVEGGRKMFNAQHSSDARDEILQVPAKDLCDTLAAQNTMHAIQTACNPKVFEVDNKDTVHMIRVQLDTIGYDFQSSTAIYGVE